MEILAQASVAARDVASVLIGTFRFADSSGEPTIALLPNGTQGDLAPQLLEDRRYEISFVPAAGHDALRATFDPPTRPSQLNASGGAGFVELQGYVGTLTLNVHDASGTAVGRAAIEVRSQKLNYLAEFSRMVSDLCASTVDLVASYREPVTTKLASSYERHPESAQQQLIFLKALFEGEELDSAIARLCTAPHAQLRPEEQLNAAARGVRPSRKLSLQIASAQDRIAVPVDHPLARITPSLPRMFVQRTSRETYDTAENRFVKFILQSFLDFLVHVRRTLSMKPSSDLRLVEWLDANEIKLAQMLRHDVFQGVGQLRVVPVGSPAMQRRSGYRQILDAWTKFNAAVQLDWSFLDDAFDGGQRKAPRLFEYWCFFGVRKAILSGLMAENVQEDLLQVSRDRLTLVLRSGNEPVMRGNFSAHGQRYGFTLHYRRSFSPVALHRDGICVVASPSAGSWSKRMEPDFTLSFWPYDPTLEDSGETRATADARIARVHLDAKYRVHFIDTRGAETAELAEGYRAGNLQVEAAVPRDTDDRKHKADDLDKMHAYLSAIRGTVAAYVLYPGQSSTVFSGKDCMVPSVGALALRPLYADAGLQQLGDLLRTVVNNLAKCATSEMTAEPLHSEQSDEPAHAG